MSRVTRVYLKPDQMTIATEARDYPEWHRGRQHYALWYIEIQQPEILTYLKHLQQQFLGLFVQPNTRQFHISLFICGFWGQAKAKYNDDFMLTQFQAQWCALQAAGPIQLKLCSGKINSFESALFIEIDDPDLGLSHIKSILAQHVNEVAALTYCPHITLGLYADQYSDQEIAGRIRQIQQQTFTLQVEQLDFGYYVAYELQGRLHSIQQFII